MDPLVTLAGAFVGFVVGLTGMGGGALMTPILVLLFHIQPLAAVSSDIVASMVMKPIGGARPLAARHREEGPRALVGDGVDPLGLPGRAPARSSASGPSCRPR